MEPQEQLIFSRGQPLMVYDWPTSQPDALPVIFFHATSFHGRCWDEIIRPLREYHCYAVDSGGHGRSYKTDLPITWQQAGEDAAVIAKTLGLRGAIGVGHSMGGNSLVRAAAALPGACGALLLIDPVIYPRELYSDETYSAAGHFTLQRRRYWGSPEEMFLSFHRRGPFAHWQDAVLRDYCRYGLLPDQAHGYQLACPPEIEANIYASSRLLINHDIYDLIPQIDIPVCVLRCGKGFAKSTSDLLLSPTAPDLAAQFQHGQDIPLPDNTHFIPMESPQVVTRQIRDILAFT